MNFMKQTLHKLKMNSSRSNIRLCNEVFYIDDIIQMKGNVFVNDRTILFFCKFLEQIYNEHEFMRNKFYIFDPITVAIILNQNNTEALIEQTIYLCVDSKLQNREFFVLPVCYNSHWFLLIYYEPKKLCVLFDSLQLKEHLYDEVLKKIQKFFSLYFYLHESCDDLEHKQKKKLGAKSNVVKWDVFYVKSFPKQLNNYDCGIYVLVWIYNIFSNFNENGDLYKIDQQYLPICGKSIRELLIEFMLRVFSIVHENEQKNVVPLFVFTANRKKKILDHKKNISNENIIHYLKLFTGEISIHTNFYVDVLSVLNYKFYADF